MKIHKKQTFQPRSILSDWEVSQDKPDFGLPPPEDLDYIEEKFWVGSKELKMLMDEAAVRACWNFLTALGDTISEKYESLYLKVMELTEIIEKNSGGGYFWMITSPEISSIFETAKSGFEPADWKKGHLVQRPRPFDAQEAFGTNHIFDMGTVNRKWRLFKTSAIPAHRMLIGVNNQKQDPCHYAVMSVENFIL